ncbi:MAG TPA: hypothetical protein VHE55_12065 [Fimbriimonadaceae bacterium]|nr:hypothetical protein [Fimbriimonadaceae bacterium]
MKRFLLVLWLGTLVGLLYAGGGVHDRQADLDNLRNEINSLKTHRNDVDSKLNNLSDAVDELRRQRDDLRSQVDTMRSQLDAVRSQIDDNQSKINNTLQRSDVDSLHTDFNNFQQAVNQTLRKASLETKKELGANAGDINRLQADQKELAEAAAAIRKEIESLQKVQQLHTARLEQVKKQTHIKAWVP